VTVLRAATPVVSILLVASGCTDAGPDDATGTSTARDSAAPASSAIDVPCDEAIDTDADLPDSYTVIADAVALPTAASADRALQTSHREENPAPNYFAKTGLAVRPGVAFTIEVDESSESALIGWGSPAGFGSAITTDGCTGDGWVVFAGGFLVDEPRCVEVDVSTDGGGETAEVGVGAPCEGQQLPPEPTDP
jgi:hypothetical protein